MTSRSSQILSARKALPSRLKLQFTLILALVCIHLVENCNSAITMPKPQALPNVRVNPLIKTVTDDVSELGEGPYWDAEKEILYYVDATSGDYCRLDPKTRQVEKINQGTLVSMIIPYQDEPNTFVVTRRHELLKLNWSSKETEVLATVSPDLQGLERFNDVKCDPRGRLFLGTVLETKTGGVTENGGALYRLDGNKFTEVSKGFSISNGMAWSNDANHTKLYFNDSEGRKIYSFDYDIETGTPSNKKIMIDCDKSSDFVAGEYPDGMLIDKFGYIWVAMYAGGRVVKIDVDTARVVDQVVLKPNVRTPSSLAPGIYQGNDGFFVTTAAIGIPQEERLDDGKILHISFQGGEVYKFKP